MTDAVPPKSKLLLGGVMLNVALVALAVLAFPGAAGGERTIWIIADCLVLVGYAAWLLVAPPPRIRTLVLGAVAGFAQLGDIAREYLTNWPAPLLFVSLLATIALFAISDTRLQAIQAAAQGASCGITAMLVLWPMVWALNVAAADRIGSALVSDPDYLRSGITGMPTYIVWNTLSSALSHALLFPVIGAAAAALASGMMSRLRSHSI